MGDFVDLNITTDEEALQDLAIQTIESEFPGWEPAAGNLETVLLEAVAQIAAENALITSRVPEAAFRNFGLKLADLPPKDGTQAIGSATFTATDALGHTVPAGTFLAVGSYVFETAVDLVIGAGSSSGVVAIVAVEPGVAYNDASGPADLVDTLAYVDAVALLGSTSGGIDPETDDEYLDRLVDELQLLAPRPIVPSDFEVMAMRVNGVDRATAVDGYNPDDDTYENERRIALAAVDEDGAEVSSAIKDEIDALIQSRRETNFVFNVIAPTYTTVDVTAEITVLPGFDSQSVLDAVSATVTDFLEPYNWGRLNVGQGPNSRPWVNTTKVAYLNVAQVVKQVEGVAFVDTLTIDDGGGPVSSDLDLSDAPAPLTQPGTITVTET